jgi:hypothetical protein
MLDGVKGGLCKGGVGSCRMGSGGALDVRGSVTPGIAGTRPPGSEIDCRLLLTGLVLRPARRSVRSTGLSDGSSLETSGTVMGRSMPRMGVAATRGRAMAKKAAVKTRGAITPS